MTVIELARQAGVTPDVIRYYARIGLLKPKRNPANNYKQFSDGDLKYVRFIRRAQRLGFTLAEIAEIIKKSRQGNAPCPMVRETIERRIEENSRALTEMIALQDRMERALAQWKTMPDGMPDGHAICVLIEAIE
ncbi:MAG: MerR family transcriptional regulator [Gammaproteobacteria bacterium]|nr:MerR family transcriptional regulator [Gammaproteobacteria bacterium]